MATLGVSDVHYYDSEMPSAPVLTGLEGGGIGVLRACLINGFGSQAPQGAWVEAFTGTNVGVFKSTVGTQSCLWFNDNVPMSAQCRGYESMTSVSEGTNPFPFAYQTVILHKSNTYSSTERRWSLFADSQMFYLFTMTGAGTYGAEYSGGLVFGDYLSYSNSGAHSALIIGGTSHELYLFNSQSAQSVVSRSQTNAVGPKGVFRSVSGANVANHMGRANLQYPSYVDDTFPVSPVELWDADNAARGVMPGIVNPLCLNGVSTSGGIYGKHFDARGRLYVGQQTGPAQNHVMMDLTGPWR